jgi:hypothetical protein
MAANLLIYGSVLLALMLVAPNMSCAQASKTPQKAETEAWRKAKASNTFEAAVNFVKQYPKSGLVKEARTMFPRLGKSNYHPSGLTAALYLENGDMYAIAEVGGGGKTGNKGQSVPLEEGLSMLQTKEEREVWYEIVSSEKVPPAVLAGNGPAADAGTVIRVVTSNLHVYLIYGLSFNFTGKIRPL